MVVVVHALANQQAEAYQNQLIPIYWDAFSISPFCKEEAEVGDFAQSLPRHVQKEGFRIVVALEDLIKQVAGFAYGYANPRDQFWYEKVAEAVQPWMMTEWLTGSFRLVEMAVTPEAQGQGIGSFCMTTY